MCDGDIPTTVRYAKISEHLQCSVCLQQIEETMSTTCGHRYCRKCITESVDRHHKCPVCNSKQEIKHLIKDQTFDALIAVINEERKKSENQYFKNLVDDAVTPEDVGKTEFSPVECVLKKHLKQSLIIHERYYQDLKRDFQQRVEQLDREMSARKENIEAIDTCAMNVEVELKKLEEDIQEKKSQLEAELTRCAEMLAETYDRYLTDHVPDLNVLPVRITLNIVNKCIQMEGVEVKPTDSLAEVKAALYECMEKKGDKIVKMEDVKFWIIGPFEKGSQGEMEQMVADKVRDNALHPAIKELKENHRPVMQLGMKNGSHIAVSGQIELESELPKSCFIATFKPDTGCMTDYFTCKDCTLNWICRSCVDVCHKKHNVVPYIMQHKPTWACCYCAKKSKKCSIRE